MTVAFDHPVRIRHATVPGRLRLTVAGLRRNPDLARSLDAQLPGRDGIRTVQANPLTGNLLIRFDPKLKTEAIVAAVIRRLADALAPAPVSLGAQAAPAAPAEEPGEPWHSRPAEAVLKAFGADGADGLGEEQAEALLAEHGPNALPRPSGRSAGAILAEQVATLPVGLLLGSAVLSVFTGGRIDALAIGAVVVINAAIGFTTESGAERTIRSLDRLGDAGGDVIRSGKRRRLPAEEVVPGDLLSLTPGTLVAADARLVAGRDLSVDESVLTGESLPTEKSATAEVPAEAPLGERTTMVYRGTTVSGGEGRAVVVATARHTEIGRIQALAGAARAPETPSQRQLGVIGRRLGYLGLGVAGTMMTLGLLRGYSAMEMVKSSVALAVAALPEGLPTVATVTLALGIRDMRRHDVLIRRLTAVESLGAVDAICFDKTGTLTLNRMTATRVLAGERRYGLADGELREEIEEGQERQREHTQALTRLLTVCALCNESRIEENEGGQAQVTGSATEAALLRLALDGGCDVEELRERHPLRSVNYRSEARKYMVTRHDAGDGAELVAVKGAPAEVLGLCGREDIDGEERPLSEERRAAWLSANERLAGDGLRVLGFAIGRGSAEETADELGEAGIGDEEPVWLGLVGMSDPIRPEMAQLMSRFHRAGIRTIMITGDQTATAFAVARELGLSGETEVEILEGSELDKLDPEVLAALAQKTDVYARVSPTSKLQIVRALQRDGDVVAMTGDGVNDGPALRAADIGLAMGSGSDAAHEVSDVVLQNDELATMIIALAKGRTVYANIRKAVHFLLATNLSEILTMVAATGLGVGRPLTPMQLLWINIVSDIFPGLALGIDPPDPRVLDQPPRAATKPILERRDFTRIAGQGGIITLAALASALTARGGPAGPAAAGSAFTTLTVAQLLHAYSCRSETRPAFGRSALPANRALTASVAGLLALQALVSALPWSRGLLGLSALGPFGLARAAALGLLPFAAIEARKALAKRRPARPDKRPDKEDAT